MVQSLILHQTSSLVDEPLDAYVAPMCIDGGTNISLMGRVFHIVEFTDCTVNMVGFASGIEKHQVRIASSGIAVFKSGNDKVLIGLLEAPYLPDNGISLLSTGQAREHGVWVDDVLTCHGGRQLIRAHDENGNPYDLPLELHLGLMELNLRYPTETERESLPVIWLTSDSPWDPAVLDENDFKVLPSFDDFVEASTNLNELQMVDKPMSYMARQSDAFQACALSIPTVGLFFWGSMVLKLFNGLTHSNSPTIKPVTCDYKKYRRLLGWLPVDTICKTFEATTQLCKELPLRYPLGCHWKARNPAVNVQRRQEGFATDTLFSSEPPALGGYTCTQLFCGLKSQYIQLFGMHRESEGPSTLEDLIRDIRNDNSKMQTGFKWREVLRKYCICKQTTEPHHPEQNPAERRIQEVKKFSQKIMDRTGAPSYLWLFCMLYVVYLLNRCAMEQLNWRTPHELALGETPDLSALMQFAFYEPVYYFDEAASYPETKEKLGWFLGPAEHCGDDMTFWILTTKKTVIARSVVRSALVLSELNKRETKPDAC